MVMHLRWRNLSLPATHPLKHPAVSRRTTTIRSTVLRKSSAYTTQSDAVPPVSAYIATDFAANEYPGMTTLNSPRDAFRHARWQAELTQRMGQDLAELWGAAHEYESTDVLATRMDQHNNAVGRSIGASYNGGVAGAIRRARDRGELQMWMCPDIESTNSDFCS